MKRLLLAILILSAGMVVNAQGMAKSEGESIASYLSLDTKQKQAVIKLYASEEQKIKQDRDKGRAAKKPSKASIDAREKEAAKGKSHASSKSKVNHSNSKSKVSSSQRMLLIAYGKAKKNASIDQGLKGIFTPAQYDKWNKLGK